MRDALRFVVGLKSIGRDARDTPVIAKAGGNEGCAPHNHRLRFQTMPPAANIGCNMPPACALPFVGSRASVLRVRAR